MKAGSPQYVEHPINIASTTNEVNLVSRVKKKALVKVTSCGSLNFNLPSIWRLKIVSAATLGTLDSFR